MIALIRIQHKLALVIVRFFFCFTGLFVYYQTIMKSRLGVHNPNPNLPLWNAVVLFIVVNASVSIPNMQKHI